MDINIGIVEGMEQVVCNNGLGFINDMKREIHKDSVTR